MAKPKQDDLVRVLPNNSIHVYTNEPEREATRIVKIEGVINVSFGTKNPISVYVDPRYDKEEVAQEIEELLVDSVPDVFRE